MPCVAVRRQRRMQPYGDNRSCSRMAARLIRGPGVLTMRDASAVVRELRTQRGWTQQDLATRARLSRSFVADVESGKPTVESAKLFDLFQALGYEVVLRDLATGQVLR
ncbi:MAG: hypothetical protein DSY74_04780 [Actinobacteria bacterium]|nr:MAG: hypothetical protein DSY74_04780 [Actinomycetota bacterium]